MNATSAPIPRPAVCRQMYVVTLPESIGVDDDIDLPPAGLLRFRGADAELVAQAYEFDHRVVVIDQAPLERAAQSALQTRRAAAQLAHDYHGLVIDMFVPAIITTPLRDISLDAAAQWFALSYDGDITLTHGMERFGLPEIRCQDTETYPSSMGDAILVGLVHRLISQWPAKEPTGLWQVSLGDIARGYGQPEPSVDRHIRVGVEYLNDNGADSGVLAMTVLDDPATQLFQ